MADSIEERRPFKLLERLKLLQAIQAKKRTVILREREYSIRYEGERVFVKPTRGAPIPCGWFRITEIENDFRRQETQ